MDAHLFRLFADNSRAFLNGAMMEKIREPMPGLLALELYNHGVKKQLLFRSGKQKPFMFFSGVKLPVSGHPSAQVMRLRKFFMAKRVVSAIFQVWQRKLWLMAGGQNRQDGKNPWLCLDLARGWSIHFLDSDHVPLEDDLPWPEMDNLENDQQNWKQWPMLTPALRKTLENLDAPERMALINDLETGGGAVFLYETDGKISKVSAWPLIGEQKEEICENVQQGLERAGNDLVLTNMWQKSSAALEDKAKRKIRQLERLLDNLEKDEKNLQAMAQREQHALAIRESLWRIKRDEHVKEINLADGNAIPLDGRFTVVENMERMFKQAARGKRGLEILQERKKRLAEELSQYQAGAKKGDATENQKQDEGRPIAVGKILPKNIAAFHSSDGFLILRGKDAKGNQAIRKMAQPHDLWAHVEKGQGAHVIIRKTWPGQEIPERTLEEAGSLAASKSWLANAGQAAVMYAEARHVKPMRKGVPGMVTIDRLAFTRTVPIKPELESILGA